MAVYPRVYYRHPVASSGNRARSLACLTFQRSPVFARYDRDEAAQGILPLCQQLTRPCATGGSRVLLD